jgi:hypothetical protein
MQRHKTTWGKSRMVFRGMPHATKADKINFWNKFHLGVRPKTGAGPRDY